ncbi:MAG: response regulator transcription factor [Chitinophagaceae bacterium]|nr:response regulator transcription factor [Chitinophagaceae bacterium]
MNNLKVLIVEDDILIAEHIKDFLEIFGLPNVFMAHTKKTALEMMELIRPDLALLDINLNDQQEGIQIAKWIDEGLRCPYIFLTANSDLLVVQKAVSTKTAAYITKPIKQADLFAAIQLALKVSPAEEEKYLVVKDSHSTVKVLLNDILYVESSGNYIQIFTKKGKIICRQSLEWARDQLPSHQFIQTHRSFIVNSHQLSRVSYKTAFVGNTEVPISKSYYSRILEFVRTKKT